MARNLERGWLTPAGTKTKVAKGKRKVGLPKKITAKAVRATIAERRI